MVLKIYRHPWMAHRSYLILDPASGTAAAVDPVRDVDPYLEDAWMEGCRIRHVFLTRLNPGYETGARALQERAEALIHVGVWARPDYAVSSLKDGDVLEFGEVRLQILETPGQALESISILVFDLSIDTRVPLAVLTGGTLLIGDVGFPEPCERLTCRELAGMLHRSLRDKLLTLPGTTRVYPGHDAAAPCGVPDGLWTTIDLQRHFNYALHPMSRSTFAGLVCQGLPRRNGGTPESGSPTPPLRALPLDEFLRHRAAGFQSLDVRGAADFAGAHLEGSLHVGLDGPFGDWAGSLLERGRPVGVIAPPGREAQAAILLGRAGFEVAGFLRHGMESLEARPDLIRSTPRLTAGALAAELSSGRPPAVLDVRTARERRAKRIGGSVHIPLDELGGRISELPQAERLAICCSTGYRSTIAASLLERECVGGGAVLIGGMAAWEMGR